MIAKLFRWYFKALGWLVVFMLPLFVLMIPVEIAYDWLRPWDEAVAALEKVRPGELRVLVGFVNQRESLNGEVVHYRRERVYILLPSVFLDGQAYEFSEGTGIEKGLKDVRGGVFPTLVFYSLLLAFCWFVSRPKIKRLFVPPSRPVTPLPPASPSAGT